MTESAQGRPPVDETRPSAPDQDAGSSVPADTGAGMGRGEADTFEPEESQPADEARRSADDHGAVTAPAVGRAGPAP